MRTCIQRGLYGVLLAGGVVVLGAGSAAAADMAATESPAVDVGLGAVITVPLSSGSVSGSIIEDTAALAEGSLGRGSDLGSVGSELLGGGILEGNVIAPEVVVPVNVSGNSVSVIGDSVASGDTGSSGESAGGATGGTTGSTGSTGGLLTGGILEGNVIAPEVVVPVNVGCNDVSVLGDSDSECATGSTGETAGGATGGTTGSTGGILDGNVIAPEVVVPVNVGCNDVSVLGDSDSECATGSSGETAGGATGGSTGDTTGTTGTTGLTGGILEGNVIAPEVVVPVNVGCNDVSVLGDSASECATGSSGETAGGATGGSTGSTGGILEGNVIAPEVVVPVNVGCNDVSVLGDSATECGTASETPATPETPSTPTMPDNPTTPTTPTDPITPTIPTDPITPGTPVTPTAPVTPSGPTTPMTPGTSKTPVASVPGTPDTGGDSKNGDDGTTTRPGSPTGVIAAETAVIPGTLLAASAGTTGTAPAMIATSTGADTPTVLASTGFGGSQALLLGTLLLLTGAGGVLVARRSKAVH